MNTARNSPCGGGQRGWQPASAAKVLPTGREAATRSRDEQRLARQGQAEEGRGRPELERRAARAGPRRAAPARLAPRPRHPHDQSSRGGGARGQRRRVEQDAARSRRQVRGPERDVRGVAQGRRLQAQPLRRASTVKLPPLAVPQLGSCASSLGSQPSHWAPSHCPGCSS